MIFGQGVPGRRIRALHRNPQRVAISRQAAAWRAFRRGHELESPVPPVGGLGGHGHLKLAVTGPGLELSIDDRVPIGAEPALLGGAADANVRAHALALVCVAHHSH
jgi:hypothetical protein